MDINANIKGVYLTPLKIIPGVSGDIFHAMKNDDPGYDGFGEAYFSAVNRGAVKGWKKHTMMVLNIVVPVGKIKFVIYDDRENSETFKNFKEVELSNKNYQRLTVSPGLWLAFQGKGEGNNILLNMANIKHNPEESINIKIDSGEIVYEKW